MDLFACRRGFVVSMQGCKGMPGKLKLEGFEPLAAIIEAPALRHSVNMQFMESMDNAVYAYAFGDNMGVISLRGVAFAASCETSNSGLKTLSDYYKNHRAVNRKEPVTISIGSTTYSGFLTELDIGSRDPSYMLLDFTMIIRTLPAKG